MVIYLSDDELFQKHASSVRDKAGLRILREIQRRRRYLTAIVSSLKVSHENLSTARYLL